MEISKKGQMETADIVSLIFTFIILIVYIILIVLGSFATGEIESVINAETKIDSYNQHITLINYLDTEVEYEGKNVSFFMLYGKYFDSESKDGELRNFINEKSEVILEKLEYCFYDPESGKPFKRNIEVLTSDELINKINKYISKINLLRFTPVFIPQQLDYSGIGQKIDKDNSVYLIFKNEGGDCELSHIR